MKLPLVLLLAFTGMLVLLATFFIPSIYPLPPTEVGAIAYISLVATHILVGAILITPLVEYPSNR